MTFILNMVASIFTWSDPIKSGVVFGSLNLFFLQTVLLEEPVISVLANVFFIVSVVGIVLNYMGKDEQVSDDDEYEYIGRETFENLIFFAENLLSKIFGAGSSDMGLLQSFLACLVLYYVGMLFSLGALLWLLTIGAFSVPLLYAQNQEMVDGMLGQGKSMYSTYSTMAMDFIPRAKSAKSNKQE